MIKTFRGLLADEGQERIRLSTIKGKVGYKIVKFELMDNAPGAASRESIVKIYKTVQTTSTQDVNFTDSNLLAAGYLESHSSPAYLDSQQIIFDREIFNQDIYITHIDVDANNPVNYYIELEVIPLDDAGAEYTTLKDMRQ
ncbi:unnamed protein product [marine sediment metagenome]|uniref:Uncharacterized protein n=1 Tax=marine sediment metagenome TaxID=412755 RepID=X1CW42_9ZZZZ